MTLDFLFNPKSVAVVGVSSDPSKLGSVVFTNMISAGYQGKLYPVNPKYNEIFNNKCYAKVSDIPEDVDVVCIVVPPQFVKDVLEDSGNKGVKGAVIITAGFGETGDEGKKLENEILETAKKHNIRILGPNCLGSINTLNKINLSFAATNAIEGNIAFLSQSGAFCTAMLDMSLESNLGFSHLVSIGNKSDLNENDFVKEWLEDDKVAVIGAYLEDVRSGHDLSRIYTESKSQKPLVIFKPGESEESQVAIASHTGSLTGSIEVFETAMHQAGITVAKDIDSMFNYLQGFAWSKLPKGKRVGILTNAGGPGVIATDFIIKNKLVLDTLSEDVQKQLAEKLPSNSNIHNPVDVIGDADSERYKAALETMVQDENLDAILVILTPQLVTEVEETAKIVINNFKVSNKPIIPVFLGGRYVSYAMKRFYDNKVPAYRDISSAIETLAALYNYNLYLETSEERNASRSQTISSMLSKGKHTEEINNIIESPISNNQSPKGGEQALDEELVMKLAEEVGIPLPKQKLTYDSEDAIHFAKDIYPVVIKAPTKLIVHKTDEKALYLNIQSEESLRTAFRELLGMLHKQAKHPSILVQQQLFADEEIFVGIKRDGSSKVYESGQAGFGHLIAFGKGGIYTEIYKDIVYNLVPTSTEEILEKLKSTKVYKIINGARGKDKLDEEKLVAVINAVQKLVLLYPQISSLDINPLMLSKDNAIVVDMKVFVAE